MTSNRRRCRWGNRQMSPFSTVELTRQEILPCVKCDLAALCCGTSDLMLSSDHISRGFSSVGVHCVVLDVSLQEPGLHNVEHYVSCKQNLSMFSVAHAGYVCLFALFPGLITLCVIYGWTSCHWARTGSVTAQNTNHLRLAGETWDQHLLTGLSICFLLPATVR